jgi:drug/metabolite transporter (DMT)-like permease
MIPAASKASSSGALAGLLAAALFGLSAPLAKLLLADIRPVTLAGLLYCGAGIAISLAMLFRRNTSEATLKRADCGSLLGVVVAGGILAPILMLVGLDRVRGVVGSLLLNLEAPFTILLAVVVFREHLGRRTALAAFFVLLGAGVLKTGPGEVTADAVGVLCITAACLCWGLDNNLTQRLSLRDPFTVVRVKTLVAGMVNLGLGLALGERLPALPLVLAAAALGAVSYGASVVLDAYALRLLGAAREAAYFATAPFLGALLATVVLHERLTTIDLAAMTAMIGGVVLLLRERHAHPHRHEALAHEHSHTHDDEHHRHEHVKGMAPGAPHVHGHRHEAIEHDHPHTPDAHHRHDH